MPIYANIVTVVGDMENADQQNVLIFVIVRAYPEMSYERKAK
jgi:hypothetical protein